MMEGGTSGRLRAARNTTKEDQAIQSMIAKGERELVNRRRERAEARRLRLLELERQREAEDKMPDADPAEAQHRRRKSILQKEDSDQVDGPSCVPNEPTDPVKQVEAVEKRWQEVKHTSRQLMTDKLELVKQVEMLKDKIEDADQELVELKHESLLRLQAVAVEQDIFKKQTEMLAILQKELEERTNYMTEKGLIWPPRGPESSEESSEEDEDTMEDDSEEDNSDECPSPGRHGRHQGLPPLEKQALLKEIGRYRQEVCLLKGELQLLMETANLEESSNRDMSIRDTARSVAEYKSRLEEIFSEKTRIVTQVQWLEGTLRRLKSQQEEALQLEDELKTDKRKLQREVRQAGGRVQELELEKERLQKRVETLHRKRHGRE